MFKKEKYQNVKKTSMPSQPVAGLSLHGVQGDDGTWICFIEEHPEISRRPHQSPEYRMHLAKLIQQYVENEEESRKEDEENPADVKERKKIEKKVQ